VWSVHGTAAFADEMSETTVISYLLVVPNRASIVWGYEAVCHALLGRVIFT